jgi:hypothetical protein
MNAAKPYLSICSVYKDHAEYLREWIEFHRLVGVERFLLYDNESSDDHEEVLAPYRECGIVELHQWPTPQSVERGVPWSIIGVFNDCIERHRHESRWIAFLDVDEFLFSPTGKTLPDVLSEYERFSGVEVSRLDFGPSGHRTKPSGLVIESYLYRRAYTRPKKDWEHVKSIVVPTRVDRAFNSHGFFYREGYAVREIPGGHAPPDQPLHHEVGRGIRSQGCPVGRGRGALAGRPGPQQLFRVPQHRARRHDHDVRASTAGGAGSTCSLNGGDQRPAGASSASRAASST